jgi:hypothetical protein
MFKKVLVGSRPALMLLLAGSFLCLILFGSLMYFVEGASYSVDYDPVAFPEGVYIRTTMDGFGKEPTPFRSIPAAFWWVATTMTTVGYGDFYPTTSAGRVVGVLTFFAGIVNLALPVTIIGANFSVYYGTWVENTQLQAELTAQVEQEMRDSDAGVTQRTPIPLKIPGQEAETAVVYLETAVRDTEVLTTVL